MSCAIRSEINKPISDLPHALLNTPTATASLPPWVEVSIWTSKAWDEVSYNRHNLLVRPLNVSSYRNGDVKRHILLLSITFTPLSIVCCDELIVADKSTYVNNSLGDILFHFLRRYESSCRFNVL